MKKLLAALLITTVLPAVPAAAQVPGAECVLDVETADFSRLAGDAARLATLSDSTYAGSFLLQRTGQVQRMNVCAAPASLRRFMESLAQPPREAFRLLPAEAVATGNSAYPRPSYDGTLWNGRGVNAAFTAGAAFRAGPFSAAIAPVFAWSSNAEFELAPVAGSPYSPFGHPTYHGGIDAPQRFGSGSLTTLDVGNSYARVDVAGFGAGISNQNIVWGPSLRNPLLLSASAPGFPHVFVETSRPVDVWIGRLDAQLLWGRLAESDYFDEPVRRW